MIKITLPNGNKKEFVNHQATVKELIAIDARLVRDAIAAKVDNKLVDLSYVVRRDAAVKILTAKDQDGLDILRHSAAHLLAHAVCELFLGVEPTVGLDIENGFYHDFYYPKGFNEDDLLKIEDKMKELAKIDYPVERSVKKRSEMIRFFEDRGEHYKAMMLKDVPNEEISFYRQGSYINACFGPHVPSTRYIKAFKLTKLAGAYWKGDPKNEMLQRIYGTAWSTEKELKDYLVRLERAKQCDHRLIGKKMDLFHLQQEAPGMVFWHPNGWTIYSIIKSYLADRLPKYGYQEINTPIFLDRILWEKSGHWDKYREVMFTTESENHIYAIKPMSCSGHIQIFKQGLKSYRDLPIKYAEFGHCHRNEISGALHGIMRIRSFTQDDAHVFCTEEQIGEEAKGCIDQIISTYTDFGFKDIIIKLSTRPVNRIGSDTVWDKAEKTLVNILDENNMVWKIAAGDGAFYGPKIDFLLRDSLGRIWQCGTLQVDFSMPERAGAYYIAESGEKKPPVLLHRAMLGSIERFIGILLEETEGNLPIWLAPIQAVVVSVTDDQLEYAKKVTEMLKNCGYRVICDLRSEKLGFKIRKHTIAKIPYVLVVGNKEIETDTVSVRSIDGKDLGQMAVEKVMTDVLKLSLDYK